jgi:predicted nucleic-acid-binding Zn-ribbon protein
MEEGSYAGLSGFLNPLNKGGMFIRWVGKIQGNKDIKVYRCEKCGYLENYAK